MRGYTPIFPVFLLYLAGAVLYFMPQNANIPHIVGVQQFGHIAVGGEAITGHGSYTFAPYFEIPASKFYVMVIENDRWCSNESCSLDGAFIETMGGWLQAEKTCCGSEIEDEIGLNLPEHEKIKKLVIISDSNNKIAGIYPNRGILDALPILRLHPDLADFSLIEGVQKFGILKVGEPAPLLPGDSLARFGDEPARRSITHVPKDKKFYLFSAQKRRYDIAGDIPESYEGADADRPNVNKYICFIESCRYPEPDPPHDFLFADVEELGGWFFSADEEFPALSELFGLDHEAVLRGDSSLVVLTDSHGIIAALHPGKTLADTFTILSQHPDLADMEKIYPQQVTHAAKNSDTFHTYQQTGVCEYVVLRRIVDLCGVPLYSLGITSVLVRYAGGIISPCLRSGRSK